MTEEKNVYYFDSRVRFSETAEDLSLTPGAMIDYLQDCSTLHAEDSGVGIHYMKERHQAWILISWQIQIRKMPVLSERIRTKTWAYAFQGFFGKRNYTIEDVHGNEYVRAMGLWVLMDMEKGFPMRVPQEMIDDGNGAEIRCQYCNKVYNYDTEDLKQILELRRAADR